MVEQRAVNAMVGGSSPSLGAIPVWRKRQRAWPLTTSRRFESFDWSGGTNWSALCEYGVNGSTARCQRAGIGSNPFTHSGLE